MSRFAALLCCVAVASVSLVDAVSAAEFTVEKTDRGVTVNLDGKLFTEYLTKSGQKPILWPIIGPTGKPMTRAWPMDETGAKTKDHPHHRSLWFSHGDVNGADLWTESDGRGSTEHKEFLEVSGGKTGKIVTKNDWLDKNGKKLAEDERTLTFSTDGDSRIIDFDITIKASAGELKLGDTKEGTFAVRVPDDFRLPKQKGKGRIINSEGIANEAAWGKTASWVDYEGPIDGETCGIAILNHPSSYGYPTHWHVRDYGLFAANPFGLHDFSGGKSEKKDLTLKAGESMKLRYRVIFHKGDEKEAHIAQKFKSYEQQGAPKRVPVSGQIRIDGQPLRFGSIRFLPTNARPSIGELDKNGRFLLSCFQTGDGALIGQHRIEISAAEEIAPNKIRWHAPKKYSNANTSGLAFEINEPTDSVVIDLTWDGGKPFVEVFGQKPEDGKAEK